MAYNPQDPNKLEDENEVTGAPPPQLSAPGSSIGQGSPPAGGPAQSPSGKAPSASGFTNVQKYIKANETQGGALGQKIAGKIDSSIADASTKAQSAAQGYRESVNPNQYNFNAKTFNPKTVDTKLFSNLFSGPRKSTYNDSSARDAVDLANKNAAQIQTNEGRRQLVGAEQELTKGTGQNTAGLKTFDRLLFQGSEQGRAAIDNTAKNLESANLESKLFDQGNIARGIDQEYNANKAVAAGKARGAVTAEANRLRGDIDRSTTQGREALARNQERVFSAITNREDLSDADLRSFGIDRNQYNQVRDAFGARQNAIDELNRPLDILDNPLAIRIPRPVVDQGFNLQPFFNRTDLSSYGASNAITPDQIARARALASLGGISGATTGNLGPTENRAFNNPLGSVDIQSLINALNDRNFSQGITEKSGLARAQQNADSDRVFL